MVEVLADGGIRVTTLEGATGLASLPATRDWIAEAQRDGVAVHLRGEVAAPSAVAVAEEVRRLAPSLDETPSQPAPWPKGRSSIQTAASNGLTEQVTDLLDRGISPNDGRVGADAVPPRDATRTHRRDGRAPQCRSSCPPRPRAAGGAPRRGRAPRLLAAVDLVAARAVPRARRGCAVLDGAYAVAPAFVIIPLIGIGAVHLVLGNTRCAFDGPHVARRRGRHWQGPIDLRTLDALGYTPPGTVRMPVLWVLGQREAGDRPDVYAKSAFDKEQRT